MNKTRLDLRLDAYIKSGLWRCSESPTGAHYWIITDKMRCKYCDEERQLGEGKTSFAITVQSSQTKTAAAKRSWRDPEYRAKLSAARKRSWQDPEYRAKQRAALKRRWQDPEYRVEQSAARKGSWQDPEYQAKQSASRKGSWQDPEYRAKQSASVKRRKKEGSKK